MTLYKKLHYDTKNKPPYFITTLHPTQVPTFLFSPSFCYHPLHHLLPTYVPLQPTYIPTFYFNPPFLSCYYHHWPHVACTSPSPKFPWPNLVIPNLCVPWPPTTPSTFHLHHAYICLHLCLFPCHKQAINFKLVIIFLVLYIYMK
jgi:hypothetical protein